MLRYLVLMAALALPTAALAEWHEAETPHFIVYADDTPENVAGYARELEAVDFLLRTVTGTTGQRTAAKLDIYVFDEIDTIRRLIDLPPEGGAIFSFSIKGPIAVVARADSNRAEYDFRWPLFHEYAHHFMTEHMTQLTPLWFMEGFASLFESIEFTSPNTMRFGAIPPSRNEILDPSRWIPVREVFAETLENNVGARGVQTYAQGWLLSHHLFFGGTRSAELKAYLNKVGSGQGTDNLDQLFAGGLTGLDADLQAYAKVNFATRDVSFTPLDKAQIRISPMTPGEAAAIGPRIRLAQTEGYDGIDSLLAETLSIARRHPGEQGVAEFAAWLAYFAHEYDTARQLIAPFQSAPLQSPRLLTLRGKLVIREALDGAEAEQFGNIIRRGRRLIQQALTLAPNDPMVLMAMYASYEADLVPVPPSAYDYMVRAIAASPGNASIRFEYADEMIKQRDFAKAAEAVRPIANSPHASRYKLKAQAYLSQLQRMRARG